MQRRFYSSVYEQPDLRPRHPSHVKGAFCGPPPLFTTYVVYPKIPINAQQLLSGQIIMYPENAGCGSLLPNKVTG